MACDVIARRDRVVADGVRANEADLSVAIGAFVLGLGFVLETLRLARFRPFGCRFDSRALCALLMCAASAPPPSATRVVPSAASSSSTAPASASVGVAPWTCGDTISVGRWHNSGS
jgi:hypothetical protein